MRTRPITFNAHASNSPTGLVIKFWTLSKYSHASVSIGEINFESTMLKGVEKHNKELRHIKMKVTIFVESSVSERFTQFLTYVSEREDRGFLEYDFTAIIGFILNKNIQDDTKWVCSEFVDTFWIYELDSDESKKKLISPEVFFTRLLWYIKGYEKGTGETISKVEYFD